MGTDKRLESALETRIRMLRDLEESTAKKPDTPPSFLGAIRELLSRAERQRDPGQD